MNLSKIFRKFQNGHHFEVRASFYTGSCIGICIIQQDRPCYYLHLELLIDAVAQILTKLLQFQNLTYFLTSWPTYLTFDLETLHTFYWAKIHLWVTNSEDMLKRSWFMRQNVLISFKHEYRRQILSSWCDVTGYVISMKILFLGLFAYDRSISNVKLRLSLEI